MNTLEKRLEQKHAIMDAYLELITKIITEGINVTPEDYRECYKKLDEILKIKYK